MDPKYTCAFLLDLQFQQPDFEEVWFAIAVLAGLSWLYVYTYLLSPNYWQIKSNLSDVIQIYQQGKARQLSAQSEPMTPAPYPEYILPYLVHALAHHSSFPNIDECKDVKAFESIYRYKCFLVLLIDGYMYRSVKSLRMPHACVILFPIILTIRWNLLSAHIFLDSDLICIYYAVYNKLLVLCLLKLYTVDSSECNAYVGYLERRNKRAFEGVRSWGVSFYPLFIFGAPIMFLVV